MESYEREAVDYLLKPIAFDRFLKAIEKARERLAEQREQTEEGGASREQLFLKSGSRIHQINTKDLLYMKKDGHYIVFHTTHGEIMSRMNMEELLNSLPKERYARIHKSYVIAIDKIDTIEKHDVIIRDMVIPIGDHYREAFLRRIRYSGN